MHTHATYANIYKDKRCKARKRDGIRDAKLGKRRSYSSNKKTEIYTYIHTHIHVRAAPAAAGPLCRLAS
jgi:hypothetical protein